MNTQADAENFMKQIEGALPNTPWWTQMITIFVTAFVSVIGTVYAMAPKAPGLPGSTVGSLVKDTITYFPHVMLLFGVLADMFTYEGVYSIPSIVGILSIPLNMVFKYFWVGLQDVFEKVGEVARAGPTATTTPVTGGGKYFENYDGCNIQGFEGLGNPYAPQTLVVTATVFSYYIFDLVNNRGIMNAIAAIVVGSAIFLAQVFVIGDCTPAEYVGKVPSPLLQAFAALTEGLFFGGSSYAIVQSYYPTRLPSAAISPFPRKNKNELTARSDGTLVDADGIPYILLPNGQAVPDLGSKVARNALAASVGKSMGSGVPATPASCKS